MFSKRLLLFEFKMTKTKVDYNGRCETPVGDAGKVRPRRAPRRLSSRPTERE